MRYANFKAQRDGVLESGFLRFYGTAELYESGPVREAIFQKLTPREQTRDGADKGIGVFIKIERAANGGQANALNAIVKNRPKMGHQDSKNIRDFMHIYG